MDVHGILVKAFADVGVDWYIKGILDSKKQLYTISNDTKLISKVFELISIPIVTHAVEPHVTSWEIEERQTVYPDLTLILNESIPNKIAIDIKSTYRRGARAGFTLGSYTAYIRPPFTKNIRYPYTDYTEHWIVGFIYDRVAGVKPDIVHLSQIDKIIPPVKNVEVVIWQKWQIASDKPGSGDTANIGSVGTLEALRKGQGIFTKFGANGKNIFEDYWRNFDWKPPRKYTNLNGYVVWRKAQTK
jgi:hypothetical protein